MPQTNYKGYRQGRDLPGVAKACPCFDVRSEFRV